MQVSPGGLTAPAAAATTFLDLKDMSTSLVADIGARHGPLIDRMERGDPRRRRWDSFGVWESTEDQKSEMVLCVWNAAGAVGVEVWEELASSSRSRRT